MTHDVTTYKSTIVDIRFASDSIIILLFSYTSLKTCYHHMTVVSWARVNAVQEYFGKYLDYQIKTSAIFSDCDIFSRQNTIVRLDMRKYCMSIPGCMLEVNVFQNIAVMYWTTAVHDHFTLKNFLFKTFFHLLFKTGCKCAVFFI